MAGRRQDDPKVAALRETRSLNPQPGAVSDEAFSSSEFLDARDLVQVKYEMVRRVRVDGEPVARAAERFGFSRPSFYAAQAALDEGGLPALVPQRPGPRRAHKLSGEVLAFARELLKRLVVDDFIEDLFGDFSSSGSRLLFLDLDPEWPEWVDLDLDFDFFEDLVKDFCSS